MEMEKRVVSVRLESEFVEELKKFVKEENRRYRI